MTARRRKRRYQPVVTLRPTLAFTTCRHCYGSHYPGNSAFCVQRKTERLALR